MQENLVINEGMKTIVDNHEKGDINRLFERA